MVKDLKRHPGFKSYIIMNNDGIVIKWDQIDTPMPYGKAVQHAHLVLDLCSKSKKYVRELFDGGDNEVENIRLRTDEYELIAAQHGKFTLIVIQEDELARKKRALLAAEEGGGEVPAE
jgi:dynein light chain roadblock-type